ncbi:MAG: MarR family transcriptional regulator [Anaerolineales bacterium]|jgi:DNA-binding MarR family transcriptional regulator
MSNPPSSPVLIDKFWESVPPAWRQTRSQIRHNAVEKFKMTEEQFQVLRRICDGSASVSALAETSQTSRSAVSKAVEPLVRRGLVARSQNLQDRRNLPLALTEEGRRVMDLIYGDTEAWLSSRFARLTLEETKLLLQGLELLRIAFINS